MGPLEIREELKRKHNEVFSQFDATPAALVHYTPPAGLGIITSGEIWCKDIRDVNDQREGDYGAEIIMSVILRKSVPRKFVEAMQRSSDLFGLKRLWTWYTFSFISSHVEQPYMWTNYAACGTGCAIVFDFKKLFADAEEGKRYALFPILYDLQEQIRTVEEIVDHAIQFQRRLNLPARDADRFWAEEVAFSLMNCGSRFKAPCWQPEQEYRMAVASGDNVTPFNLDDGHSRVALPFDRSAVLRVVRGREAGNDLTLERIRGLIQKAGYGEGLPVVESVT